MKKIYVCFFFFLMFSIKLFSQETTTVYYNEEWEEVSNKDDASYYRKAFKNKNKVWTVHDYYINKKIQMTGFYISNRLEVKLGLFIYYYENGQKSSEGEYLNNYMEGQWSYWYESGKIKEKNYLKSGLIYSTEVFYKNGKIKYSGKFKYGKRHGKWIYWNTDGRITVEGDFKKGKRHGEWIRYFRNSKMTINFYNGTIKNKQLGGIIRRR